MPKLKLHPLLFMLVAAALLFGCTAASESQPTPLPTATLEKSASDSNVALRVTGLVETEMSWTEEQVRAMETMQAQSTNNQGDIETYTGVSMTSLLAWAGIQDNANTLVFIADDGKTAEVPLSNIQACDDCIVSFRNKGGFSLVLPGFDSQLQVKGIVEIQVN